MAVFLEWCFLFPPVRPFVLVIVIVIVHPSIQATSSLHS